MCLTVTKLYNKYHQVLQDTAISEQYNVINHIRCTVLKKELRLNKRQCHESQKIVRKVVKISTASKELMNNEPTLVNLTH